MNDKLDTEKLHPLIMILKANGDKNSYFQRIIQNEYLKANLLFDKNIYEISEDLSGVSRDTHAVLYIKKGCKTIAWICVDENLYIGCEKLIEKPNQTTWRDKCWAYISPEGYTGNKFKLNDCENILKDLGKINIQDFLEDIEQ